MLKEKNNYALVKMSIFLSLICVCSLVVIPIPYIPITLQTVSIFFVALIFNKKDVLTIISMYLILGCVGFPVFAGGKGGIHILFGPTGGFLIGFLVSSYLVSYFNSKNMNIFLNLIFGNCILYLCGIVWFMVIMNKGLLITLKIVVFPFILGDILKMIMVYFLVKKYKELTII